MQLYRHINYNIAIELSLLLHHCNTIQASANTKRMRIRLTRPCAPD